MKINASITANYFLKKSQEEKLSITLMKLLKLVYIAHGWAMALLENNQGILGEEKVEAWQHGPVIPSLYHEFKHHQDSSINDEWSQTTVEETENSFLAKSIFFNKSKIENKEQLEEIFNAVWEAYKEYSAWGLSQKTHEKGTPWEEFYNPKEKHSIIPNEKIREYYKTYLQSWSQ